jgi:hypothetical protein
VSNSGKTAENIIMDRPIKDFDDLNISEETKKNTKFTQGVKLWERLEY